MNFNRVNLVLGMVFLAFAGVAFLVLGYRWADLAFEPSPKRPALEKLEVVDEGCKVQGISLFSGDYMDQFKEKDACKIDGFLALPKEFILIDSIGPYMKVVTHGGVDYKLRLEEVSK